MDDLALVQVFEGEGSLEEDALNLVFVDAQLGGLVQLEECLIHEFKDYLGVVLLLDDFLDLDDIGVVELRQDLEFLVGEILKIV